MKTKFIANCVALAALGVVLACLPAFAEPATTPMHARISFESGGGMIKGSADTDWSYATINTLVLPGDTLWVDKSGTLELEMAGGNFLRMADGSKADIIELSPQAHIKAWNGSFYVQRTSRSSGDLTLETPVCSVVVERDTQVRIDVLSSTGATTISVRWGRSIIRTPGGQDVILQTGLRCYVDPGYLPSEPRPFNRAEEDSFDTWNRERSRVLAAGAEAVSNNIVAASEPMGVADLEPYGEWVYVDSARYWRPTVIVDYVPYRTGHWSFVPGCGYVWVGDYPFCYVTSHYGRWIHHSSYGWIWGYRDTWGPAWVASVRYGPNFVWCPLDPWDRPVVYGSATFAVGGINFGIYSSSYCLADDLFWGPCYVNPCTPVIVSHVPVSQVYVWNINVNSHGRPHFDWHDSRIPVRDYSPRRSIRGPEAYHGMTMRAHERVATLESSEGRVQFASHTTTRSRSVRTPVVSSNRSAQVRSVRLDAESAAKTPPLRSRAAIPADQISAPSSDGRMMRATSDIQEPTRGGGSRGSVRTRTLDGAQPSPNATGDSSNVGADPDATTTATGSSRGPRTRTISRMDSAVSNQSETSQTSDTPAQTTSPSRGVRTRTSSRPTVTTNVEPSATTPTEQQSPRSRVIRMEAPTHRSSPQSGPDATASPSVPSTRTLRETAPAPSVQAPSMRVSERPRATSIQSFESAPAPTSRTVERAPAMVSTPRVSERSRSYSVEAPSAPSSISMPSPSRSYSAPSPSRSYSAPSQPRVQSIDVPSRPAAPMNSMPSRSFDSSSSRSSMPSRMDSGSSGMSSGSGSRSMGHRGR